MVRTSLWVITVLTILAAIITPTTSLRFYLKNGEERCFTFDAESNSIQRGEASVATKGSSGGGEAELDVRVMSVGSSGHETPVYSGRLRRGKTKFSFRTPEHGHRNHHHNYDEDEEDEEEDDEEYNGPKAGYQGCIRLSGGNGAVYFSIIAGHNDADPADTAASDNGVQSVSAAMRDMHTTLTQVTRDISRLQQRENKLMRRNAKVGSRIVSLACLALVVLLASTAVQVVYLKSFFKQKKLM